MNAEHPLDSVSNINVYCESRSMLIKASSIGLNNKIRNILGSLMKLSPELQQNFMLLPESQVQLASVVFVDADSVDAIYIWQKLERENPDITPVWLYRNIRPVAAKHSLKLPLTEFRLTDTLISISPQRTRSNQLNVFDYANALKVLVVDESLSVRQYMYNRLTEFRCGRSINIDFAESGEIAMDNIKTVRIPYDLIFLEVMLEDIDGFQVCRWVKKFSVNTRVVMLTSRASFLDKIRGSMSGCDMYLTKPPKDIELLAVFQKLG